MVFFPLCLNNDTRFDGQKSELIMDAILKSAPNPPKLNDEIWSGIKCKCGHKMRNRSSIQPLN